MTIRKVIVLAGILLVSFSIAGLHTSAVSAVANVLKVSPVRSDIEIQPGGTQTVKATVTNLTDAPLNIHPIENDFVAGDEKGTPALILNEDQYAQTHSLKRFMSPLKDVTIPAKGAAAVEVTITVPKDAQAGGYFGAIRFAPSNPDGGGQVNLDASAASLILLTVPGDLVEKINMTNFDIQQKGITGTFFHTPDNMQIFTRFESSGNVQVSPIGKISVKNGSKVVYETDFNNKDPHDTILPDSARRWDIPLDKDKLGNFGKFTVYATFTYGKANQTIEVTKSFWIIPWLYIIAAGVALIVLIGLVFLIVSLIRRRKRRPTFGRR